MRLAGHVTAAVNCCIAGEETGEHMGGFSPREELEQNRKLKEIKTTTYY